MDDVLEYQGKYRFLSNFYPAPVEFEGKLYPTVEHAYQAAKTTDEHLRSKIRNLPKPGQAKRFAREMELRPDWERVGTSTMITLNIQKFEVHRHLAKMLLETDDARLQEGNYWHDNRWGNCLCKKCENIHGLNMLGVIHMTIRDTLKRKKEV